LLIFTLSAWRVAPMIPGGDEPHYLVITQSLLLDGDLSIEDVHRRGDYRAYYAGELPPHVQRRGRDGEIYSVHAPGLPVLVAPAFAIGGYPAAVAFLVLLASAASALAWTLARMATGRLPAAWFGWAAVTLPATAIFQSITVYPDGVGGILALTGLWALLRAREESASGAIRAWPWLLHGAALAALPWLHSRFAVIAGGFGALVLLRLSTTRNPAAKAVAFLSVPAVSAILWVGYFVAIYGTADPSAPYGPGEIGSFAFGPGGLAGLLFDQRFGVITYAPVLAFALGALFVMLTKREWRRLALELLFVIVPYLLTVTHFAMWWGGWSPPARFFAPVLPLLAVPAAIGWTMIEHRATRFLAAASLVLTALASLVVIGIDPLAGMDGTSGRSHGRGAALGARHRRAAVPRHLDLGLGAGRRMAGAAVAGGFAQPSRADRPPHRKRGRPRLRRHDRIDGGVGLRGQQRAPSGGVAARGAVSARRRLARAGRVPRSRIASAGARGARATADRDVAPALAGERRDHVRRAPAAGRRISRHGGAGALAGLADDRRRARSVRAADPPAARGTHRPAVSAAGARPGDPGRRRRTVSLGRPGDRLSA
jgi:hypothetical protein